MVGQLRAAFAIARSSLCHGIDKGKRLAGLRIPRAAFLHRPVCTARIAQPSAVVVALPAALHVEGIVRVR